MRHKDALATSTHFLPICRETYLVMMQHVDTSTHMVGMSSMSAAHATPLMKNWQTHSMSHSY
jgi:hypothetical protein